MAQTISITGVSARACGDCTLCCKLLAVRALSKAAAQWCNECDRDRKCLVYDSRPNECRDYSCLWLTHPDLSDDMRPDKAKAILGITSDGKTFTVTVAPDNREVYKHGRVKRVIERMLENADVLICYGATEGMLMRRMSADSTCVAPGELQAPTRRD